MLDTNLIGLTLEDRLIVSEDMLAILNNELIHPFLASTDLLKHMEWTCRKLIMPSLQTNYDAIGSFMSIKHISSAVVGMTVFIKATVTEINNNKIVCRILATSNFNIIAEASVEQTIVLKEKLTNIFNNLMEKDNND